MPRSIPPEYRPVELLHVDRKRIREDGKGIVRFFFYVDPIKPPPGWKMQLEAAWSELGSAGFVSYDNDRVWLDCTEEQFGELRGKLAEAVRRANDAVKQFFDEVNTPSRSAPNTKFDKILDSIELGPVEGP